VPLNTNQPVNLHYQCHVEVSVIIQVKSANDIWLLMLTLHGGQTESNIEMIALTPLSDLQLSAALSQQVQSPNRVFSTPSCHAAVAVGFPDCVNIIIYLLNLYNFAC